jgi:hypothetical protein
MNRQKIDGLLSTQASISRTHNSDSAWDLGTVEDTKSPGNAKIWLAGAVQGLQVNCQVTGDP